MLFDSQDLGNAIPSNPSDTCWSAEELYWLNWYDEKPFTTLWLDGNHENFDRIDTYPVTEWNGGKVQKLTDSVIHLMRGQVYNLDGVSIFTMGGAMSHDRGTVTHTEERDIHKIWWPQEMITPSELMEAQRNLTAVGNQVDLVLTHTVPESVLLRMGYYTRIDPCSQKLEALNQLMDYKYWFAGHMHCNEQYGKVQILYNRIVEYKKKKEIYKCVL